MTAVPVALGALAPGEGPPAGGNPRAGGQRQERPGHSARTMLTESQQELVEELFRRQTRLLGAVRDNKELSAEQKAAQVRVIREFIRREIRNILTDEQQEKLRETFRRARERSGPDGRNIAERVADRLRLSQDQRLEFGRMIKEYSGKTAAILSDESLDRDGKKAAILELREKNRAEIERILTPEQMALHDEIRAEIRTRYRSGRPGRDNPDRPSGGCRREGGPGRD